MRDNSNQVKSSAIGDYDASEHKHPFIIISTIIIIVIPETSKTWCIL